LFAFAGPMFFSEICYEIAIYKTGFCNWIAISHSLNGILDIGGVLAPAIYMLLFLYG
jgi:hypothetical protein